ncbi:inner membrane magnesium transporter mrs2 [Coccidioides immitis H538.4]|uniref:Magnesium transporter n=2 Tax=Coccidioides immitis TaxID=5501 RepID=A0A0J8S2D8_COCIT|nr:inner membrane magnesium transporter mrs2 [Coccidioides immitis RMSCC 2394]KMU91580.1 inner membrane magnesium transporter mrs2 [Coccidioides immitis H538.4]TPX23309.1 magnesium ion transporter [Coccidioides immitis]
MVSPSFVKPSAPSLRLLRFLRSQSDICCFKQNVDHPRPRVSHGNYGFYRNFRLTSDQLGCGGLKSSAVRCPSTLEASLLSFIRPKPRKYSSLLKVSSARPPHLRGGAIRHPASQQISWFSGTSKRNRNFLRRLLGLQVPRPPAHLKPDDLPSSGAFEDGQECNPFTTGRKLALKASNEPRLRCTEFDENGNVTLISEEFKKSELIAKYGLLPRDLRKIDSSVIPHILVRHSAILLSLLHLRVLIKANRVLVFDAYGSADTYTQSLFMYDLEGKLRQKEPASSRQAAALGALPYEFRALEAVLVSVTSGLEAEFEGVREPVVRVLRALEEDIDRDKLRHLLIYSKRLGTFEQKARLVRDAIEDLLEADDDLTAMYLSERSGGVRRDEHDHQEIEMLLESYHKVCDEIVQASGNLVTNIRNTEEIVKAILDANRNSLMLLELKVSIGTLGLAVGTLLSALYGMNLKNFIEESDLGFGAVSAVCFASSAFVCIYGLLKLRRVQRVKMWGEGGIQDPYMGGLGLRGSTPLPSRGNWRSDAIDPAWTGLPVEGRAQRMRRVRGAIGTAASQPSVPLSSHAAAKPKLSGKTSPVNAPQSGNVSNKNQTQKQRQSEPEKDEFEDPTMGGAALGASR